MGNRANICVKSFGEEVYLYTHWDGDTLPATLQRALKREARWNDGSYLARIIFCEMVKDDVDGETGYGISAVVGDGDNRILYVNTNDQTVSRNNSTWSFEDYIELDENQINNLWRGK